MEDEEEDTGSDGSLDLDLLHGLSWQYHPLWAFLLDKLIANDIPIDHKIWAHLMFGTSTVMKTVFMEWNTMLLFGVVF